MDVKVWNLMIFLKNLWLVGFTVLTQQYMIFLKICFVDFFLINSLEKEIGESRLILLKVLLFKTMSTINASPAFLDSDGLAKGFMAWQHTFFFFSFQKLMLFVVMWIK